MKFAWLVVPPAFALGLAALAMRFKIESKRAEPGGTGKLIYSIHRDDENRFHIVSHAPQIDGEPTLLLLDPPSRDPHAAYNPVHRT